MTEDEAKTKWCPAFRGNNHGVNRPDELKTDAGLGFCMGSACMAWRWMLTSHGRHVLSTKGTETLAQEAAPNKLQGFCGLAGQP